ncbi:S9 family peptidase [Leptolyngbya sp. 15MV]|nr:S9 family peptidase [Leptolyngbya sp. 15MV]
MKANFGSALALAAALAASPSVAQGTALMSARDLVTLPRLGSPTISPDGTRLVYPVTITDPDSYARTTEARLRNLADASAEPVTLDLGGPASSFAFGPDGMLYFLSSRAGEGGNQVWRVAIGADGSVGAPQQVTRLGKAVSGFSLAPTGSRIALWADMTRGCDAFGCTGDGTAHLPGPGDGRLYDGTDGFVRHWDTWKAPGTFARVRVFDLAPDGVSGTGVAVDGPAGEGALVGDTPHKPFGGGEDVAWAPDGSGLYFVAKQAGPSEPVTTNTDVFWSALDGGAPVNLTAANQAMDLTPAPSPDGRWLAWTAMARPGYEADRLVVHLRDLASGEVRALTDGFDRSFGTIAWTPDSRWIIATAQDVLDTPAFRIDPTTGAVEKLDLMPGNEGAIGELRPLPGDRLLFSRSSIGAPAELFWSQGWGQAMPLTAVASPLMGRMASVVTTRFSFAGAEGATVWGQITKPERHQGKLPAILYVHGGPQGSFNDAWSTRWNPRVLASQGYAVVSIDFHGSTGYGQAFTDAINQDWGGKPLEDLKLGLAAALERDSSIDGSRACAMGASYGGYMMNWIAGQWPDRFKCLVNHNGLFDTRAFYYSTEELWFPRWDFGGSYADAVDSYEKWNPVHHVDKWQTPMLVVLGEKDFRVPYTQGLGAFTAMQERGIPTQLLVFPGENHWVLGAKNSLQWHNVVFDWLDRWLKPTEGK